MSKPLTFYWRRRTSWRGVRWELWSRYSSDHLGSCFYLPGSKRYTCRASAPVKGGAVLCDYYAGTAAAARRALECDWDKRSIGLFGVDVINFEVVQ